MDCRKIAVFEPFVCHRADSPCLVVEEPYPHHRELPVFYGNPANVREERLQVPYPDDRLVDLREDRVEPLGRDHPFFGFFPISDITDAHNTDRVLRLGVLTCRGLSRKDRTVFLPVIYQRIKWN